MALDIKLKVQEKGSIVEDIDDIQFFNEITLLKYIFPGKKQPIGILEIIVKNDHTFPVTEILL